MRVENNDKSQVLKLACRFFLKKGNIFLKTPCKSGAFRKKTESGGFDFMAFKKCHFWKAFPKKRASKMTFLEPDHEEVKIRPGLIIFPSGVHLLRSPERYNWLQYQQCIRSRPRKMASFLYFQGNRGSLTGCRAPRRRQ